jgi:hypothetical protein
MPLVYYWVNLIEQKLKLHIYLLIKTWQALGTRQVLVY